MSARDEAIAAVVHAACTPGEPGCEPCQENAAEQLDAIPDDVLRRLLAERAGVLYEGETSVPPPDWPAMVCKSIVRLDCVPGTRVRVTEVPR